VAVDEEELKGLATLGSSEVDTCTALEKHNNVQQAVDFLPSGIIPPGMDYPPLPA
jgi:hypothetical protein